MGVKIGKQENKINEKGPNKREEFSMYIFFFYYGKYNEKGRRK